MEVKYHSARVHYSKLLVCLITSTLFSQVGCHWISPSLDRKNLSSDGDLPALRPAQTLSRQYRHDWQRSNPTMLWISDG